MSEPERPAYVVAVCEGATCVMVADLDDLPHGRPTAAMVVTEPERTLQTYGATSAPSVRTGPNRLGWASTVTW